MGQLLEWSHIRMKVMLYLYNGKVFNTNCNWAHVIEVTAITGLGRVGAEKSPSPNVLKKKPGNCLPECGRGDLSDKVRYGRD